MKRALALFLLLTTLAEAREEFIPGSRYVSGRGSAMGDAIVTVVDDSSALFYNPAGLSRIKKAKLEVMNLQLRSNTELVKNLTRDFYNFPSLASYGKTVVRKKGMEPAAGFSLFPSFSVRGFGIGVLAQADLRSSSVDGQGIRYRSNYEFIPAAGFSRRFASGVVKIGYSVLWVNRAAGDVLVDKSEPNLGYNQYLKQGAGLSHNAGFALTLPYKYLPAFNVVGRNLGGLKYTSSTPLFVAGKNSVGTLAPEPMTIDVAFGAQPKVGSGASWNLSAMLRDALSASGASLYGRFAFGIEFAFRDAFFLRGGYQSGYLSAGFGMKTSGGELNLSWYGEEYGNGFRNKQDLKYMFQYKMRAF